MKTQCYKLIHIDQVMYYCIHCLKSWKRNEDYIKHFKLQNIKVNGRMTINSCFQKGQGKAACSLSEAKLIQECSKLGLVLFSKRTRVPDTDEEDHQPPCNRPSTDETRVESDTEQHASPMSSDLLSSNSDGQVPCSSSSLQQEDFEHTRAGSSAQNISSNGESIVDPNMSQLIQKINDLSAQLDQHMAKLTDQNSNNTEENNQNKNSKLLDDAHNANLALLTSAKSMKDLLENKLVNNDFEIDRANMVFKCSVCPCDRRSGSETGIKVTDWDYNKTTNTQQERWFRNTKILLKRHIITGHHLKNVYERDKELNEKIIPLKVKIFKYIRHLAYYIIKTNTAFSLFPTLLAVAARCDIEIGDTNHSRMYLSELTGFINEVLVANTKRWFSAQTNATVVSDIGTVMGLVLTVVILIGDRGVARVAGCRLTPSKEGAKMAELMMTIVLEDAQIDYEVAKEKIRGVCCDGAFCKLNDPFKSKFRELLDNSALVFHWDLMHLVNRAHRKARGLTSHEKDHAEVVGSFEEDINENTLVSVQPTSAVEKTALATIMDYIQS